MQEYFDIVVGFKKKKKKDIVVTLPQSLLEEICFL